MRRQEVLKLLGALPLLALRPSPAAAMGGTLPALDQLAPDFDLESAGQNGALGQRLQRDDFAAAGSFSISIRAISPAAAPWRPAGFNAT